MSASFPPRATCRIQLRNGTTLERVGQLVPYLDALGVSHLYLSPVMQARRGSSHGYDVVDPTRLDPLLGDDAELERLAGTLRARGMGILLDWVPNHLGVGGHENPWWLDVLAFGVHSPWAGFFDIDWDAPGLDGRLVLPFLGAPLAEVLEKAELRLELDAATGSVSAWYHEHRFPISPRDLPDLMASEAAAPEALAPLLAALRLLGPEDREPALAIERELAQALGARPALADWARAQVERAAAQPARLASLLARQAYRLASWREADDRINYRRFFEITDLAALRMERVEVFDAVHARVLEWIERDLVQGLRIDHVDGLFDPLGYLERLRGKCPAPFHLVVEKILERDEALRPGWPVDGTTGYEFLNEVNGLWVDPVAEGALESLDRRFTGRAADFETIAHEARIYVMSRLLGSDLRALGEALESRAAAEGRAGDAEPEALSRAFHEVVACFPVYRTYVDGRGASVEDRRILDRALTAAERRTPSVGPGVFGWLRGVLLAEEDGARPGSSSRPERLRLAGRVQQLTGPVAAKGLEDTAFYRHQRLVSLNEVGGDPGSFGVSVAAFHAHNVERSVRWPHALLATATHDTKRGEDTRARIDALSECPAEWGDRVDRWRAENARHTTRIDGSPAPDGGHEYLLYQTLVGSWPGDVAPGTLPPGDGLAAYRDRVAGWLRKAIREGKQRSSWRHPRSDYEDASERFLRRILDPSLSRPFLEDFVSFQAEVAALGATNGLAQLALKLTVPGVPDLYQGCELWDLSLADPDNRRPVDWEARAVAHASLREASAKDQRVTELARTWWDGRIKLLVAWRLLELRRSCPELFSEGDYRPLEVCGERAARVCAFARVRGGEAVVVATPRLCGALPRGAGALPLGEASWGDDALLLPEVRTRREPVHVLSGRPTAVRTLEGRPALRLAELFAEVPVAAVRLGDAAS